MLDTRNRPDNLAPPEIKVYGNAIAVEDARLFDEMEILPLVQFAFQERLSQFLPRGKNHEVEPPR